MADPVIIQNKLYGTVVVHASSNCTVVAAGNSTVSSIATGDEVLKGAIVKQVWWGGSDAKDYWTINRNGNTAGIYNGSGHIQYAAFGTSLSINPTANVDLVFKGTAGYIMIELQKVANNYPSTY